MIPNRSQSIAPRQNLTMLSYQHVLTSAPAPHHEHNPASYEEIGHKLARMALTRIKQEVAEVFKDGPITISQLRFALKLNSDSVAGDRMRDWMKRGLVGETGEYVIVKAACGNGIRTAKVKLWDMVKDEES